MAKRNQSTGRAYSAKVRQLAKELGVKPAIAYGMLLHWELHSGTGVIALDQLQIESESVQQRNEEAERFAAELMRDANPLIQAAVDRILFFNPQKANLRQPFERERLSRSSRTISNAAG